MNAAHVYGIVQDSKSFMWIGTSNGLLKFDGVEFTPIELPGLKNYEILELKIDEDDNLWFMNLSNQLCRYSIINGVFQIIQINNPTNVAKIWISEKEVAVFKNTLFGAVLQKKSIPSSVYELGEIRLKSINSEDYIYSDCWYNLYYKGQSLLHGDTKFLVRYLFRFSGNTYFLHHNQKDFYKIIKSEGVYSLKKLELHDKSMLINGITIKEDTILYLSTNDGIYKYNNNWENQTVLFKGENCTQVILDNEDNLWVTTMNNGLYFF